MSNPDPLTTEWVPIWNPMYEGPAGPAGPPGPTVPNLAYTNVANTFTTTQYMQGLEVNGPNTVIQYHTTTGPPNGKVWRWITYGDGFLRLEGLSDDQTTIISNPLLFSATAAQIGLPLTVSGRVTAGSFLEAGAAAPMGYWANVPFDANNFSATLGMAVAVNATNVPANRYSRVGKTLFWLLNMQFFSTGGPSGDVLLKLPGNLVAAQNTNGATGLYKQSGASPFLVGNLQTSIGSPWIMLHPLNGTHWIASADNYVWMNAVVEVQ